MIERVHNLKDPANFAMWFKPNAKHPGTHPGMTRIMRDAFIEWCRATDGWRVTSWCGGGWFGAECWTPRDLTGPERAGDIYRGMEPVFVRLDPGPLVEAIVEHHVTIDNTPEGQIGRAHV